MQGIKDKNVKRKEGVLQLKVDGKQSA